MTDRLLCGIDIGSTNVKVLLIDAQASTVWSRSIAVPRVVSEGRLVTDAVALVDVLEGLIIEGWRATGSRVPIAAISATGVGEDGVPVDVGLRPLDRAIPWFDRRADDDALVLRELLDSPVRAGVPIDGTRTVAKWRWLRRRRPQVMREAHTWLALSDFPTAWWSQQPFISETLAARTGAYDVFDRRWLTGHLAMAGAPMMPPVARAGTVIGMVVRGALLDSGAASTSTLLVAGGHDHPVAASVVRRLDPNALVDSLGTANLVYGESGDTTARADPFVAFSVPALGYPGVACLGVFEFSASLEPLRGLDAGLSLKAFLAADRAAGVPGSTQEILQVLRQLRPARGAGGGVTMALDLRTVLEAGCFYARRMVEAVRATGCRGARVHAVGGWARSTALLQLRASVFGEPIATVNEAELTALGAALVALEATGADVNAVFCRTTQQVFPDEEWQERYAHIYPRIRDVLSVLSG